MALRQYRLYCVWSWISLTACAAVAQNPAEERIVELEIAVADMQSGDHQEWAEMLSAVGADSVRLKGSGRGEAPDVIEEAFGGRVHVLLKGVLQGNGTLELPGGTFRRNDSAGIRELIARYRADGAKTTVTEKVAFGLTPEQLVGLSELLGTPVEFQTAQQPVSEIVAKIAQAVGLELEISGDVRLQMSTDKVLDELTGLASGTAMAVALRPSGLVMVPARQSGDSIRLRIMPSDRAAEFWPVGWPTESSPLEAAPKMYERLAVQIHNTPLLEALAAIQGRTEVPMLLDHNSLALKGIDPRQVVVTLEQGKDTYYSIVRELLRQSRPKMRLEIRVDEAFQPFVWISPQ